MRKGFAVFAALAICVMGVGAHAESERDPLGSAIWADLIDMELDGGTVVYDNSLFLAIPERVEEAHNVPVLVKLTKALGPVAEIALFVENNPIQTALRIYPHRPMRSVGFNIRLEQSTPVRAAVRDAEGVWHVASRRVFVAVPGGCSEVSPGVVTDIGEIALKQFDRAGGASRLKVKINHPMHTGLASDENGETIPAYYVEKVAIEDEQGPIADLVTWAALSSDPVFTLDMPERQQSVRVSATDSSGLDFEAAHSSPTM